MNVAEHVMSLERSALDTVLARWNATEVYREVGGAWRIIHTHWSFTQPQPAAPQPA